MDILQGTFSRVSCTVPGSPVSQGPSKVRFTAMGSKIDLSSEAPDSSFLKKDVAIPTQGVSFRSIPGLESGWRYLIFSRRVASSRRDLGQLLPKQVGD